MAAVLQPPYVTLTRAAPQAVGGAASSSSSNFSFGRAAASGLAAGGRIRSVIGAIIGVIIMVIMVAVGAEKLRDKHTASALMNVVSVAACSQVQTARADRSVSVHYVCGIKVSFGTPDGRSFSPPQTITVSTPAPLAGGDTISLRYAPSDPNDVVQELPPRAVGWMLVGGGVALGALSVGMSYLAFKSKAFAEFEGAAGLLSMVRR
jgi:hypothetical protein